MNKTQKPPRLRCFVGIKFTLPDSLKSLLHDLAVLSEDQRNRMRISPSENLHITLKFLGSVLESRLGDIETTVRKVTRGHGPIELSCEGIGVFKNSLWLGIRKNEKLLRLTREMDQGLIAYGFAPERKTYVPHITVARFGPGARTKLSEILEKYKSQNWGSMLAKELQLYRSDTLPEGPKYTIIDSYKLEDPNQNS